MATSSKRPGIKSKRTKPQRDALGRFAPKVTAEWDGSAWVSKADQFEQSFKSEEPGWLKRIAAEFGFFLIRCGANVSIWALR